MRRVLHYILLFGFHVLVVRPVLRGIGGVRFKGKGRLPDGPCLVVSNHNSHLDAAILMSLFPVRRLARVHPVAAADYFGASAFKRTVAMMCMNGIPIDRVATGGRDPLAPAVAALRAGSSLVFFPEGSRGEAGVVARFRPGIGLLVRQVPGLPVVPVFLSGPERIWPRGRLVPVPLNIDVNVGRPRVFPDASDPRDIAEQIRADVLALAPAPAPMPGARPARALRVAVWSRDPGARDLAFERLLEGLGRRGGAVGLGASGPLVADGGGVRRPSGRASSGVVRRWLSRSAWLLRTGPREDRRRFAEIVDRAWREQAVAAGPDARWIVTNGSALVDLLSRAAPFADLPPGAEADPAVVRKLKRHLERRPVPWRRAWSAARETPELWLLHVIDLARPPLPDVVVHVATTGVGDDGSRRLLAALGRARPGKIVIVEIGAGDAGADELAASIEHAAGALADNAERADGVAGRAGR
jgi:1-acyl-sn-glycerol-3-phosphate acyltransferase